MSIFFKLCQKSVIVKFNPFITLPLFLLGIVLLLLGITTGVNIPTQGISLISEPSFRAYSTILGSICIFSCLILNLVYKKPVEFSDTPDEWKQAPLNRAANLTPGQSGILQYIRDKTEKAYSNLRETELGQQFKKSESEIYYRLEQLRLLGLITKSLFEKYQAASRLSIKRVIATYTNVSLVVGNSS